MLGFGNKNRKAKPRGTGVVSKMRYAVQDGIGGQVKIFDNIPKSPRTFAGEYRKYAQRIWGATTNLSKSNHYCRGALLLMIKNVLGTGGLALRPNVMLDPQDPARLEKKKRIVSQWKKFRRECNQDGFASLEREVLYSFLVYGEAFVLMYRRETPDGVKLKLSTIAPPRLRPDLDKGTLQANNITGKVDEGHDISLGIETNKQDEVVAYHFLTKATSESKNSQTYLQGGKTFRTDADMCLHVFMKLEPEQTRGISWFASGIQTFLGIDKYASIELAASILESGAFAIASPKPNDNTNWTGEGAEDAEEPEEGQQPEEKIDMSAKAGEIMFLDQPMDINQYQLNHPSKDYPAYMNTQLGALSGAMGLASYDVTGDLSRTSYSSGRIGNLSAEDTYKLVREVITTKFHMPVLYKWLENERSEGNLSYLSQEEYDDLFESQFTGRAPKYIDPQKSAISLQRRLKAGVISWHEAIEEEGRDPQEVLELIKQSKQAFIENDLEEVWSSLFSLQDEGTADAEEANADRREDELNS